MDWQVACDFDGTIAREDVTDGILERFALATWREIEADWKAGRIGSRECMARQVDLIHATPEEIESHLETVSIDPAFPAFAAFCRARRVPLRVVSDGLDHAIHAILGRHGLDDVPVTANRLEYRGAGRWRLASPHASDNCRSASGTCKCAVMEREAQAHPAPRLTLLIGDGASDFCAAAAADMVFAKDRLLRHAGEQALPHVAFEDFTTARRLLAALLAEEPAARIHPVLPAGEVIANV